MSCRTLGFPHTTVRSVKLITDCSLFLRPCPRSVRQFATTPLSRLRTTELTSSHFSSIRSKPDRLWSDIHSTSTRFGPGHRYGPGEEQTGLSRLTLTDSDKAARDWFIETTKSLGCTVSVDSIGNVFAVRPGLNNDGPATFVGSHLDSQPMGGRFDGVLGVCAGVEMLRVLNENWIETEGPVGVVNWTNEEGARFPVSMMGSGVWAGTRGLQEIYELKEVSPGEDGKKKTVREELERLDLLGSVPAQIDQGGVKMAGHFELHIEQGPKLVKQGQSVGAVKGVQAYKWFEVDVRGRAAHTGTTGLGDRADPLLFASFLIVNLHKLAKRNGALSSVGVVRAEPGSVNTIPDHVMFTLDVRHETDDGLKKFEDAFRLFIDKALRGRIKEAKRQEAPVLSLNMKEIFASPATRFDDVAVAIVEDSAKSVVDASEVPRMISGAGHDSVNTAKHCPTAMVFVPCKDGVSHHPEEWCEKEHCAVGTDVIIQSVLRYDQWRHKQGHFSG